MHSFIIMKRYTFFLILAVCMGMVALAFMKKEDEGPDKHLEIVLRNIGHQVLLHSDDSTSRVLPVRAVDGNTFRISFENPFRFTPDTLMNIVHQQLAKTDRPDNYIVRVNACGDDRAIFAYEVNTANGNLAPCRKRELKKGCYVIDISFPGKRSFNYAWLLLALLPVAYAGFYFGRKSSEAPKPEKPSEETAPDSPANTTADGLSLTDQKWVGNFMFFEAKGILRLNDEIIELSAKETKALGLLLSNLNQVVERDLLMKAIWEEEGLVVIPRNVDVLMSKLRKKLSGDPSIRIMNVHGKGYKMIV